MDNQPEEDEDRTLTSNQLDTTPVSLLETTKMIPKLINSDDVMRMIDLQMAAIDRLEKTNSKLVNCNALAQSKLTATAKFFKKTTKQMADSKRDLDTIYRKILDLKSKIRSERPDLVQSEPNNVDSDLDEEDGILDEAREAITSEVEKSR